MGEPGDGGRRSDSARAQKLSKRSRLGAGSTRGCGKPGAAAPSWRRGRTPRSGSPRTAPSALAASLRGSAATSDLRAGVLSAARYRGSGGQVSGDRRERERGCTLLFLFRHPGECGCRPRGRGGSGRGAFGKFLRQVRDFGPSLKSRLWASWLLEPFPSPSPPPPGGSPAPFPAAEVELRRFCPDPQF